MSDAMTFPGRSLVSVEFLEPHQDGEMRVLLTCDCATATDLTVRFDGPRITGGETEAAFTCDGCHTAHWFKVMAKTDGEGPS